MVSVIIPVYNVKNYLERCVQSVLRQTFKDMEIILVDDGSTDGSGELADQLAVTDSRIRTIHQKNQGVSVARNLGIQNARGEYVVFMDSDDEWLLQDGMETLLKKSECGCDLIVFKRVDIWKVHKEISVDYDLETISSLPDMSAVFAYLVKNQLFQFSACFLMTRRQVLTDNKIFFPVGIVDEDISWNLHLWQCVHSVSFHNLPFYGYHHRANSVTTTASIRSYQSNNHIFTHWKTLCQEGCTNKESILIYLANIWVSLGYHLYSLNNADKPEAISILKRHKDLLSYAFTPKSRRAAMMVKIIGVKWTTTVLGLYWRLRTKIKRNSIQ